MNGLIKNTETFYQQKNIRVYPAPHISGIIYEVSGFLRSETLRASLEEALDATERLHLKVWIWRFEGLNVVKAEDVQWIVERWYPRWSKTPIERVYVIEPNQVFGKLSLKKLLTREIITRMHMEFYMSFEHAKKKINA